MLTLVNALWTNMNKQWTTVFSLTNIKNDKGNKSIVHCLFMLVNTLMSRLRT